MIKYWLVTGDTHGEVFERLNQIPKDKYKPEETALIILGDVGLNFYLNKNDLKEKQKIQKSGFTIYCVRGNHEQRPQYLPTIENILDENVENFVWREPQFPNINYLKDGQEYTILKKRILVIGGAYSVDKWYRIERYHGKGWFPTEQLTKDEMRIISRAFKGTIMDIVLTHTCPYSWRPTDLFLPMIDQDTVDNSMELWMEEFKNTFYWSYWLCGHYHADRKLNDKAMMLYHSIIDLKDLIQEEEV